MSETRMSVIPDFCVGIPEAGNPLAEAYSKSSGIERIDIFKKIQTRRGRKLVIKQGIEGERARIRIIDDVVGAGNSKDEAIKAAEEAGFVVTDILVLIDREQGGKERLEKRGYEIRAPLKTSTLLAYYHRIGKIDDETYKKTLKGLREIKKYFESKES